MCSGLFLAVILPSSSPLFCPPMRPLLYSPSSPRRAESSAMSPFEQGHVPFLPCLTAVLESRNCAVRWGSFWTPGNHKD